MLIPRSKSTTTAAARCFVQGITREVEFLRYSARASQLSIGTVRLRFLITHVFIPRKRCCFVCPKYALARSLVCQFANNMLSVFEQVADFSKRKVSIMWIRKTFLMGGNQVVLGLHSTSNAQEYENENKGKPRLHFYILYFNVPRLQSMK